MALKAPFKEILQIETLQTQDVIIVALKLWYFGFIW